MKSGGPTRAVKSEIINPGGGGRGYWFVDTTTKKAAFGLVTLKAAVEA